MKKRLLVCGATGFIGRNLIEYFAQDSRFEVYGTYYNCPPFKKEGVIWIEADLTNKDDVNKAIRGMDILIQAAAATSGVKDIINAPYYHVTDNALMNSLILRSAYEHKVSHLIFFSCTVMYQSNDQPVKETDFNASSPMHPNYFGVGWTKVYIEKMCEFYARLGATKHTVIRHSNIYGPYDKFDLEKSHVFGATMTKVMTVGDGRIVVWGSGDEERDLLYISDLVDFVEMTINNQESGFELYNVGYGNSISVNGLVKKIICYSGKNVNIEHDLSKPSIKTKLCLDISKAKAALGWSPKVSLDEGIKKTMDWYKSHQTGRGLI
jgi:GDP-L-fucose synthase